ncbi:hypothetical protein EMIT0111MI5_80049 [Burkholderia sp. IT-111MI5]
MVEQLGHAVQYRDQPRLLEREVDPDRARGRPVRGRAGDLRPRVFEHAVRRGHAVGVQPEREVQQRLGVLQLAVLAGAARGRRLQLHVADGPGFRALQPGEPRRGLRAVETHRPVRAVRLSEGKRQHAQRERRDCEGRRVGRLVRRELRHRYAGTRNRRDSPQVLIATSHRDSQAGAHAWCAPAPFFTLSAFPLKTFSLTYRQNRATRLPCVEMLA